MKTRVINRALGTLVFVTRNHTNAKSDHTFDYFRAFFRPCSRTITSIIHCYPHTINQLDIKKQADTFVRLSACSYPTLLQDPS